jgi:hypothetical protein
MKKPHPKQTKPAPRRAVPVVAGATDEATAANGAALLMSAELAAYRVVNAAETRTGLESLLDAPAILERLRDDARGVQAGNLAQAEAMLIGQATAMQSLFARLAERGMSAQHLPGFEANLRFAMMAQRQSAKALETLALIKQGPTVIARSANVVNGPQQVNVGGGVAEARARGAGTTPTSELLEAHDGERLDPRAQGSAAGSNRVLAPVGAVNGSADARGQGDGR